jgi:hypothetical protein
MLLLFGGNGCSDRERAVVIYWLIYKGMVVGVLGLTRSSLVGGTHVHLIFKGTYKGRVRVTVI